MRFMLIVKAGADPASQDPHAAAARSEAMARYHGELARAGVLLEAVGLQPGQRGWRVLFRQGRPCVVDGPIADNPAPVAGYTLIEVRSREEAMEWSRRFPPPQGPAADGEIEVRQVAEPGADPIARP